MAIRILLNESNASRRAIPIWLVGSNGTTPATGESNNTFMFSIGGVFYGSGGSVSATSAVNGMYDCIFSASKVSVLGPGQVMYGSSTALPMSTPFEVVPVDSYDSMRFGLFALPNAAAEAAGGLVTFGTGTGQIHLSSGSIGLKAQSHSGASVEVKTGGIQTTSVGVGSYSGVSVEVKTGGIQTTSVGVGSYSGVSVEVKTGGVQTTSIGKGNYSGVSVEVLTGGIQTTSVGLGTYSGVTVGVGDIKPASYSGVSVEVKTKGIAVASIETVAIYSALTFGGVDNITPRAYSGVSVEVTTGGIQTTSVGKGSYSGVSVEVKTGGIQAASVGAGNYSGMSVEVKTKGIAVSSIETVAIYSALTFGGVDNITPRSYSGVSVEVKTGGIQTTSIGIGSYSGVSVEVKASGLVAGSIGAAAITSAKFGASAIDAAALATDATVEIADALLGRNIAGGSTGGRTVSEALYPLRNRSLIEGSVLTVYTVDDTTSSWTATVSTGTLPIAGIDPLGP